MTAPEPATMAASGPRSQDGYQFFNGLLRILAKGLRRGTVSAVSNRSTPRCENGSRRFEQIQFAPLRRLAAWIFSRGLPPPLKARARAAHTPGWRRYQRAQGLEPGQRAPAHQLLFAS